MPRSPGRRSDPAPGAYRPHVAARRPGGRPAVKPVFRVLVHRQFLGIWNELPSRVGLANAQQFWDHVAMTPGQPPKVGTSSVMKGKQSLTSDVAVGTRRRNAVTRQNGIGWRAPRWWSITSLQPVKGRIAEGSDPVSAALAVIIAVQRPAIYHQCSLTSSP